MNPNQPNQQPVSGANPPQPQPMPQNTPAGQDFSVVNPTPQTNFLSANQPTIAETEEMLNQERQRQLNTQPAYSPAAQPTPQEIPAAQPQPAPQPQPPQAQPQQISEENLPFEQRFKVPEQFAKPPEPTAAAPAPIATPQPENAPFDPSKVAAYASSTPINPITSTYTTAPGAHLPEDIAKQISETPMQSSSDVLKEGKRGLSGAKIKSLLTFLVFIASVFVAAFLINQFIFQSYYVEGTSMTPTLQNNDRLIISKVERTFASIQNKPYIPDRGQIVILDSSIVGINGQQEQLIKRAIGLPGERVKIEGGVVTVFNAQNPNGFDANKELGLTNLDATYTDTPLDVTVPQGQVFVLGDNRKQGGSYDSRAFGPIGGEKIQGRLWARVLPIEHARLY